MGLGDTGIQDLRLLLEVVVRRLRLAVLERLLRDQLGFHRLLAVLQDQLDFHRTS